MRKKYKYVPEELYKYCLPINSIHLWKDNPRKNDGAAEKLAELIKIHSFTKPIIVWEKNMTTYAGNTALKAGRLIGMSHIPVVLRKFTSEISAKAYGISDNKASEFSTWDDEMLSKLMEVQDFKSLGFKEFERFSDVDVEAFFENEAKPDKTRGIEVYICPHCGEEFEI